MLCAMSERDGFQHGVPCWVDTWQAEVPAAFYSGLFGWEAQVGDEYTLFTHRGLDVAGAGAPAAGGAAWTTYVWVDDADALAERAVEAGGRLVAEPFDSLDGGRMAIVADPAGAVFGVWQLGEHRGARVVNEPGAWAMSALSTPDPEGAKRVLRRRVRLDDVGVRPRDDVPPARLRRRRAAAARLARRRRRDGARRAGGVERRLLGPPTSTPRPRGLPSSAARCSRRPRTRWSAATR